MPPNPRDSRMWLFKLYFNVLRWMRGGVTAKPYVEGDIILKCVLVFVWEIYAAFDTRDVVCVSPRFSILFSISEKIFIKRVKGYCCGLECVAFKSGLEMVFNTRLRNSATHAYHVSHVWDLLYVVSLCLLFSFLFEFFLFSKGLGTWTGKKWKGQSPATITMAPISSHSLSCFSRIVFGWKTYLISSYVGRGILLFWLFGVIICVFTQCDGRRLFFTLQVNLNLKWKAE